MLIVAQCVSLLLLLHSQVASQGQQDSLCLWMQQRLPRSAPTISPPLPLDPCVSHQPPHLRGIPLQSCQEAFQGSSTLVIDECDDSLGMSLHQALSLSRHLLLQGLQNRLEVLARRWT